MRDNKMGFIVDIPQFQMWLRGHGLKKSICLSTPTSLQCQIMLLSSQIICHCSLTKSTEECTP